MEFLASKRSSLVYKHTLAPDKNTLYEWIARASIR